MARRSPLVTSAWLASHAGDSNVVIADVRWYLKDKRGIDAYRAGHIPSAQFVDVDRDLAAAKGPGRPGRHPLPAADQFAGVLARLGVRADDLLVAYDDAGGSNAARLWWLLRYFGHDVGRVLDGGIQAWVALGLPLETTTVDRPAATPLALTPHRNMVIDQTQLRDILARADGLVLDARASERFEGKVEPIDARAGHIPGAKNAPFVENLVEPGGAFLPPRELEERYRSLGASTAHPLVAYCGSGVTACHDLLALAIAGRDDARLYEGSWSEWASDPSLPAVVGKDG
jgi:thiosulfate/3-mercaptopyruvate sulfurtransferase